MRRPTRTLALAIILAMLLGACGGSAPAGPAGELNVFAAASLTAAFGEIGRGFEAANRGARVTFNFAGSNQLAQQIAQGAPADVFASANQAQMDAAIASGAVARGSERAFATNRLVVVYPKDNPARLAALKDLARPGVKLVLADKAVPVGQYALDVFAKAAKLPEYTAAFGPAALANVVSYEQNVKAVLSKVALGEADAGIVYTTDIEPGAAVGTLAIPGNLNTVAIYPIAAVKGSKNADLAGRFVDYVLSPEGQRVLARYGFSSPDASTGGPAARARNRSE